MNKKSESTNHPQMYVASTLRLYLKATWKHKLDSVLALSLLLSNIFLGVLMPFFASKVLADIVTKNAHVWTYFWYFAIVAIVGLAFNTIGIRRSMRLQALVMQELNDLMFSRLLERSVGFFNNQIGGKLVSDALDFVGAYGQLFNAGYINGVSFVATTLTGLILVLISNWQIGLAIMVLLFGLTYWSAVETKKRSNLRNQRLVISKQLTAHLSDNIVNAVTVKTFANEQNEIEHNQDLSRQLATVRITDWQRTTTSESERMGLLLLMQITLIVLLLVLTRHNVHLLATGIFAFTYTITLINRFFTINTLARQIEECFLQASPMTELLQDSAEISDHTDAKPLEVPHGEIACTDVVFHYADAANTTNVFDNLNLTIKPGETIGLVGHSGGGKSTLTRLLLRFDDISSGSIAIDGQDIRNITQASLRKQISYVPQEPLLFHRSVRENIAYGNPDVTPEAVEKAAKLAYAHEFIIALPNGYETTVGERGVKLSGGQRQRIAIARAMLKNAPILVLDEATSALDSESEKVIQKALWKLMSGKTAVVIAHRLSTIQRMDRILVLEEGKIIEDDSHDELLKQKGMYAKLWAHQSGGFIEE
jgi:ATP-binding cassette subfamily B protein